jgi:heavy metal translocating P-type ATPase
LLKSTGITAASVSFVGDLGVVEYDERVTDPAKIEQTINRLGYVVRTLSDSARNASAAGKYLRALQRRIAVAIGFGMWVMVFNLVGYVSNAPAENPSFVPAVLAVVFSLPVLLYSGWPFAKLAWRSLLAGAPGMELLISVGATSAVILSIANLVAGDPTVYTDAAVVLIVAQLFARMSDFKVRRKAQDAVRELVELVPSVASVYRHDTYADVHVGEIEHGERVRCKAGEVVPIDGKLISGCGYIQVSHLTGESKLHAVAPGDCIEAGSICVDAMLDICVEETGTARVVERLSESVRTTLAAKSDLMRLADRAAGWILPIIGIAAVAAVVIAHFLGETLAAGVARALAVLVVTCPCALALAVPLAISSAVRAAATRGFIMRDPGVLEDGRPIDIVLLDKTGTLTDANMTVVKEHLAPGYTSEELLRWAALAETTSAHPIAKTIVKAAELSVDNETPVSATETAGLGISATLSDGRTVCVGSKRWIATQVKTLAPFAKEPGVTQVYVSRSGELVGAIDIAHRIMPDAENLIASLQASKRKVMIVSGDENTVVNVVAQQLGIGATGEQRPEDKVKLVRSLQQEGHRVAFIGDGFNDGPVLAAADLGIAVDGASGLAKSAAAVVLVSGSVAKVESVIGLVEKAAGIIRQNLFWALIYNLLMLPAAVLGYVSPITAVIAMALSSLAVSANSLRLRSNFGPAGNSQEEARRQEYIEATLRG